jgi:Sigma-70, region 4
VESELSSSSGLHSEEALAERRAFLAQTFSSLPRYASPAFWQALRARETPLEVLVRCLRTAVALEDDQGRNEMLEVLFGRTYALNRKWAFFALRRLPILDGERDAAANDLCADLYECLFKAVLDPARPFWEESFLHCVYFEHKHVLKTFLLREGYWKDLQAKQGTRIPRSLIESFDRPATVVREGFDLFEIVDENAQRTFETLINDDLLTLVLALPEQFKIVILSKFWDSKTDKEIAQSLGTSVSSVRRRIELGTELLRKQLLQEKES